MVELPHYLYSTWFHSFEEDEGDVEVYRPENHEFPPTRRPRGGMEFGPDGKIVELAPGPDDRRERQLGHWQANAEASEVYVTRAHDMAPSETLEIVEASDGVLRIRRASAPEMW